MEKVKVILFMTMTLNGIIGGDNHKEGFIYDANWESFVKIATEIGCTAWGRVAQEGVDKWDED